MKKYLSFALILTLTACATQEPSQRSLTVVDAEISATTGCEFLGGVHGGSVWSFSDHGLNEAKNQAYDQAAHIGATHIVWTDTQNKWDTYATGRAYRCVN